MQLRGVFKRIDRFDLGDLQQRLRLRLEALLDVLGLDFAERARLVAHAFAAHALFAGFGHGLVCGFQRSIGIAQGRLGFRQTVSSVAARCCRSINAFADGIAPRHQPRRLGLKALQALAGRGLAFLQHGDSLGRGSGAPAPGATVGNDHGQSRGPRFRFAHQTLMRPGAGIHCDPLTGKALPQGFQRRPQGVQRLSLGTLAPTGSE